MKKIKGLFKSNPQTSFLMSTHKPPRGGGGGGGGVGGWGGGGLVYIVVLQAAPMYKYCLQPYRYTVELLWW